MSELARCLKPRAGEECGELLVFSITRLGSVIESCPCCDYGEKPKRLRLKNTNKEEPLPKTHTNGGKKRIKGEKRTAQCFCGTVFEQKASTQKYCSRDCLRFHHDKVRVRADRGGAGQSKGLRVRL